MNMFNNLTAISSQTTTNIVTGTNLLHLHTVICPKATTGTVTFRDTITPTNYFVLPIGSIGTFIFDSVLSSGLDVVTSAADNVLINWRQG